MQQFNLKDQANNYIKMFENDTRKFAKTNNVRAIMDKCEKADAVYFRQTNHRSKYKAFTNKKRPVIAFCFTKNTVCFTFMYSCEKHYFKFSEYGYKWVVDKADFLPYLQISY